MLELLYKEMKLYIKKASMFVWTYFYSSTCSKICRCRCGYFFMYQRMKLCQVVFLIIDSPNIELLGQGVNE